MWVSRIRTWISHGVWMWPWTTWIRVLLSPLVWISVNLACIASLIPLLIVVASTSKTNTAPRYNDDACTNLPSQLWRITKNESFNPATVCDDLDPSKLILMNPPCGLLHATQWGFLQLTIDWFGLGRWNRCVSLCLIHHSALAFFALINVLPEICVLLWNIMLFLDFHMLQSCATTLSIFAVEVEFLALDSLCRILYCWLDTKLESIQLWATANVQHSCEVGQCKKGGFDPQSRIDKKGKEDQYPYLFWTGLL